MRQVFNQLKLQEGELIIFTNEGGEGFHGSYENNYDESNETFKFTNSSNGQLETIYIEKLQDLRRWN